MKTKMTEAFRKYEGGLFSEVTKADVSVSISSLEKEGIDLLAWADPFYPDPSTPPHVIEAMVKAIKEGGANHYTHPIGNEELRIRISKKLKEYNNIDANPHRNIMITPGSDSGLYFAMLPFISSGDEVMIPDPSYPNDFQNVEIMGGKVVPVPLKEEYHYQININDFEDRLTSRTKMIVLTNPNNPTTTVFTRRSLEALAQFAIENDLIVIVDQAFEFPVFDGREMVTLASLEGMWERTVTVFSTSKGMGLSGFRVAYIVAEDHIMDTYYGSAVSVVGATNTFSQIGAIAAFDNDEYTKEMEASFLRRRDMVCKILGGIPGVHVEKPESGFLSWVNISKLGSGEFITDYLKRNAKVIVNSGGHYGEQGKGYIRIVQGALADEERLENALRRIGNALIELADNKGITNF